MSSVRRPLWVLVLCETSHVVSGAFRARGHSAFSLDTLPADDPENSYWHIQSDYKDFFSRKKRRGQHWDLIIAHPTCTYLTSAAAWALSDPDFDKYPGVGYHQRVQQGTLVGAERRRAKEQALDDVRFIMSLPAAHLAIENPRGCIGTNIDAREYGFPTRGKTQTVQPNQFGHDASKTTDLWLRGLPLLQSTRHVPPRMVNGKPRWGNQTDSGQSNVTPSDDRWKSRSATYPGIGEAMADQWGAYLQQKLIAQGRQKSA